ncbi:MAG TPA: hypothetical protein VIO38_15035, partial [Rariglobus sp.]
MAARMHPVPYRPPEIVDLRRIGARDLEPLLKEETLAWREELNWDFEKSADLVRRFVDLHALNGAALLQDGEVTGYLYYVLEDNKGLIGDLYVCHAARTVENQYGLLDAALDAITASPVITRVESQLMMLQRNIDPLPGSQFLTTFDRIFMRVDLRTAPLGEGQLRRPVHIERWSESHHDAAAHLIACAYEDHIDSRIND